MNSPVDLLMNSVRQLPSIPKSLRQVLDTLNKDNPSISDVIDPISRDPAMSVKVLRLSNSAYYGLPKQVASIEEAAILIGLDAIRTLIFASGLMGTFGQIAGLDMKRLWRISLLSGWLAQRICAQNTGLGKPEFAYTSALMHGLGEIAIHSVLETRKTESSVLSRLSKSPREIAEAEINAFGFHHGEVSAEVMKQWNLPQEIVDALRVYPYPERATATTLSRVVYVAVVLANLLEDGGECTKVTYVLSEDLLARVGLSKEVVMTQADQWHELKEATDQIVS